jgi:hypothetical protein
MGHEIVGGPFHAVLDSSRQTAAGGSRPGPGGLQDVRITLLADTHPLCLRLGGPHCGCVAWAVTQATPLRADQSP